MRTLKMRSTVASHQNVTAINWVDHWIWSYYNHMQNCQRTQCWPFYVYSAFEANWNHEKAQLVGASWADQKLKKKNSFKNVVFSYSTQQKANHFLIGLWYVMKSGSGTTANDNQLSGYTEKKLQNTSQSQTHTIKKKVMITVWWSAACPVHSSFLNPGEALRLEICSANWGDTLKTARPAPRNGQQKGPNSPPWRCPTICYTTNASKVEWIGLWSFASSAIFIWPFSNDYHFLSILTTFCSENASTTCRRQKMLFKSSVNPESCIFMLQE